MTPAQVLVTARRIAMYLYRELTDLSLPEIGQQFGDGYVHIHIDFPFLAVERSLWSRRRSAS